MHRTNSLGRLTVAVVATMKAGAAFTLLDPVYPMKRLENIVNLTDAKTILVSKASRALFAQSSIKCVVLDKATFEPDGLPTSTVSLVNKFQSQCSDWLSPENAMYVVFTSGSTGEPKGVVVTFGSYYAGAMAHIPYYELGPQSRNLTSVSPAFDLCIQEMVSTLMAGGCLCVPSDNDRLGDMVNVVQSMRVNIASWTPSFARQINPDDVPSLKRLALVGEAVPKDQRDAWADKVWLHNSYGPAECSVISTINKKLTKSINPANIGSMIIGSSWIVDPGNHDRLMPIGATGELLIEGPLLGRGYLNAPEKTNAVFVKDALRTLGSEASNRRFYKTGDLVRYDADGTLIFEGRKDTQIKIRGQRVELSDVEYHLRKIFPIASGVAVELDKRDDVAELVAFVFCDGHWDDKTQELYELASLLSNSDIKNMSDARKHLRLVLPHHMVPTRCFLVQKLPVLPSGKLDRKQLRREILDPSESYYQLQESEMGESFIDPGNKIALQLSERIVKLLATRGIESATDLYGKDIHLTELGLDSIQLIAILTFITKEYEVKLSVAVLYDEELTISGLANLVSDRQTGHSVDSEEQAVDLLEEIRVLYDGFQSSEIFKQNGKTVFLTGATGYLGSQILRQLLNNSWVKKVVIHTRAQNSAKALDRVVSVASIGQWWSPSYLPRIECWVGDLAAPKLGMSPTQWGRLTGDCHHGKQIDCIIHNGATVQWQAPYSSLKAANIGSTLELLSAVRQSPARKSFTYVSGGAERATDMDMKSFAKDLQNASGYSQSKFVAEQITAKFASSQSEHNISIVRPGFIIGTEREGVPNTDDFLWRLVQACVSIGSYPADNQDFWISIADVEEVASSVITSNNLALEQNTSKIRHVDTGLVVRDFWNIANEELNQSLRPVTGEEWVQLIKTLLANAGDTHPFQPFMAMLQDSTFSLGLPAPPQAKSKSRVFKAFRRNIRTLLGTSYLWTEQNNSPKPGTIPERNATFSRSGVKIARFAHVAS
jgi:amino acid adenylation domain-containing protein/thioester reductase-like protein